MRFILKHLLQNLSKLTIKKHGIQIIVVNGWFGVELVKEGIYTVLEDKFLVRRNTKPVWWDLSIPLNILGYTDKRRNIIKWLILIIRVLFVLLFGHKNPHTIVLSANSERVSTAKYWSSFTSPEILVVVNHRKESPVTDTLIEGTIRSKGIIIYNNSDFTNIPPKSSYTFGKSKSDVNFQVEGKHIQIKSGKNKAQFRYVGISPSEGEFIAAIVAASKKSGLDFEDIVSGVSRYDFRNVLLPKITENL